MSEWQTVKLEVIADVIDSMHKTPKYSITGKPLVRVTDLKNTYLKLEECLLVSDEIFEEYSTKHKSTEGDVVFARVGSYGNIGFVNSPLDFCLGQNTTFIVPKQHSKWLYYYLLSPLGKNEIEANVGGSTQPTISLKSIKNFDILLPPLPEQKAIADVLSSLDDKIDLLQRQNETLEKMAETLFRQWFIEEAKEDWELSTFDKWVLETKGGDWGKEVPTDDFTKAVYCLRGTDIANLQKNVSVNAPLRFIKDKKFCSIEPDNGDIVIEISGGTETQSTGRSYYINDGVRKLFTQPLVFSNFCRLIKIKHVNYSYFVYLYLKFLYDTDEFFALENGSSGIKNLNYKAILFELKFLMPTIERVLEFNEIIENNFVKIDENRIQIQTLQNLRDTLLPKLMNGEVRVRLD